MHKKRISLIFLIVVLFLTSCSVSFQNQDSKFYDSEGVSVTPSDDTVQFHFIDVGQGDCIFIQNGDKTVLIDAGTYESGHKIYKYLTDRGIKKLDYFIITHPHDDHAGGGENIARGLKIETLFLNSGLDSNSYSYEKFIDVLIEKDITPTYPNLDAVYKIGGMNLKFLSPHKNFGDENENSFVVLIEFGEVKALFTGDIEKKAEDDILSRSTDISADILKVAHHGSRTSSSQHFINAVYPSVAVIQCEKDNKYGHPHDEALERLERVGCKILRTDEEGTILLSTDGKTVRRSTGEEYSPADEKQPITFSYIGNKKSKVYHTDLCPNLPGENNRITFNSKEEAENSGYKKCGNCNP